MRQRCIKSQMYPPPVGIIRRRSVAHLLPTHDIIRLGMQHTTFSFWSFKCSEREVVTGHQELNRNGYSRGSVMPDLAVWKRKVSIIVALLGCSLQVGGVRVFQFQYQVRSNIVYGGGVGVCVSIYSPSIWLACCC